MAMQTRLRAKVSASAFDHNLSCWMPEEVQLRVLDCVLHQYATPVLQNGLVRNPASAIVTLMLVCRTWRHYVQRHPCTCSRQVSATGLRIAWLFDAAHLAYVEGQSKKAKLKRIPATVELLLSAGGGEVTATRSGSSSGGGGGCADGAGAGGGGTHCGGTGRCCKSSSQGRCVRHDPPLAAWSASWFQARVLTTRHRSPFERASFPERVPLLALAVDDTARLSPAKLRWWATLATSLDSTFLCPMVLRLTLPQPPSPPQAAAAAGAGPGPHHNGVAAAGGASTGDDGGLLLEDVQALGSDILAVGSDGPHVYLVPTAAALRRIWPSAETGRGRLQG